MFDPLPWDSSLFGFPVALLRSGTFGKDRLGGALQACAQEGVQLAYAFIPWADSAARERAEAEGGYLADRKNAFARNLDPNGGLGPPEACKYQGPPTESALEELALASGQFSRFRTDPRMPEWVFRDLYLTWVRRSVLGEIADAVLVVRQGDEIAAMVTVAIQESKASIGLLAVSASQRGKGLGRVLMRAAEAWAVERNVFRMEVVTQGANAAACNLYKRSGYSVSSEQAVYHFWIDPPSEPPR